MLTSAEVQKTNETHDKSCLAINNLIPQTKKLSLNNELYTIVDITLSHQQCYIDSILKTRKNNYKTNYIVCKTILLELEL